VICVSGAVTALGDTLYPVDGTEPLAARLVREQSNTVHFLIRLRVFHPVLAVVGAVALLGLAPRLAQLGGSPEAQRTAHFVTLLVLAEVAAGAVNVLLGAPAPMQILHLGLGSGAWLFWVRLAAAALCVSPTPLPTR
jgi:heme A synthase